MQRLFRLTILGLLAIGIGACQQEVLTPIYVVVTPTELPENLSQTPRAPTATLSTTLAVTEAPGTTTTQTPTAQLTPVPSLTPTSTRPPAFPAPVETQLYVAEQSFEHGRMFWLQLPEQSQIWVVIHSPDDPTSGEWLLFPDTFQEGQMEFDPTMVAPEGLQQPVRGFGQLWRENEAVHEALGWALFPEVGYTTSYRYEYGGELDDDGVYQAGPGTHSIITFSNELFLFFESTTDNGTWRRG